MQARYYEPVIGRFYSNDPVGAITHFGTQNGIHGFNRYAYANNNPYKFTDPTGNTSELAIALQNTVDQLRGDISAMFGGVALEQAAIDAGLTTTRETPVAQPISKTVGNVASLHPASRIATAVSVVAAVVESHETGDPNAAASSTTAAVTGEMISDKASDYGKKTIPLSGKVLIHVASSEIGSFVADTAEQAIQPKEPEEQ